MVFEIQYIDSSEKERHTVPGKKVVIGRSKNSNLQIDREGMSRKHLELEWDGKEFYVTDLNSTNGVYVNGERIPAGQRTIYKNFLPLEIADKITIFVYSDEQIAAEEFKKEMDMTAAGSLGQRETSPARPSINEGGTTTRTVRLDRNNSGKKGPAYKTSSKKTSPIMPLLLLALAGGGYYYFTTMPSQESSPVIEASKSAKNDKAKKNSFAIDEDTLEGHLRGPRCEGAIASSLCAKLGPITDREGILIKDDKIIVTINTELFYKNLNSKEFARLKEPDRLEMILANFGTKPAIIDEAINSKLKNILVVGFKINENRASVTSAILIDPGQMPKASEKDQKVAYENLFNAAINTLYVNYYRPGITFGNFSTAENTPAPETSPLPSGK